MYEGSIQLAYPPQILSPPDHPPPYTLSHPDLFPPIKRPPRFRPLARRRGGRAFTATSPFPATCGTEGGSRVHILARSHSKTCIFGINARRPGQISPLFPMVYAIESAGVPPCVAPRNRSMREKVRKEETSLASAKEQLMVNLCAFT